MDEEERRGYVGSIEIAEHYMSENPGVEIVLLRQPFKIECLYNVVNAGSKFATLVGVIQAATSLFTYQRNTW